jgi:flagellin
LRVSEEELISAESTIRDADMAEEISNFTRNQIMLQSATAMLGQANQVPRNILSLLEKV